MTIPPAKQRKRRVPRRILAVVVILLALLVIDYLAYPPLAEMGGRSFNRGENGLWIRYTWYFGKCSDADLARLAGRLHKGQVRDVYAHVRSIQSDGTLKYRYPEHAQWLVEGLHRMAPGVRVFAWVYVGGKTEFPPVDLTNAAVRKRMVREALWLVQACGFDGIQWDYEICHPNDPGLIPLLRETRAALPQTPLSVCTPLWYPRPVLRWYGWDEDYFARVAAECDQLAVMGYDSGIYLPRAYVALMRAQAVHITRAAARGNPRCRVIIGLPTYEDGGPAHHARAENLRLALKGVREGLADPATVPSSFAGVALFADYTTEPQEWAEYQRWWVGR